MGTNTAPTENLEDFTLLKKEKNTFGMRDSTITVLLNSSITRHTCLLLQIYYVHTHINRLAALNKYLISLFVLLMFSRLFHAMTLTVI